MDISEDLSPEDMMVHEMTSSTILMQAEGARGAGAAAAGGAAGGAGASELGRRLLLAARHGDTSLVLDLMAKGAPFTTDWLGTSALHVAARGAHADTCGVLLRAGVSRDCRTKVERTPLHLAAHAGHLATAALLLQHRAAVDCRDMLRMTPLHWAAERGHAAVAALLLRHGADPLARCKFGRTPRQLAARRRRAELVRLLDDALRRREAAAGAAETEAAESLQPDLDLDGPQDVKDSSDETKPTPAPPPEPIKINIERPLETSASSAAAAALLRRHGIALLPRDDGCTVLSALQSGRRVVLSDAGKLMLKESGEIPHAMKSAPAPAPAPPGPASKGVLLTATPVKSPPRQGVKIFTLNNKLLAMPKENKAPIKKIINPHDSKQIQYIKLPSDAKISPRSIPMKAKNKLVPPRAAPAPPAPPAGPATVKLLMQRPAHTKLAAADGAMESAPADVLFVPEEFLTNSSARYLRAQLLAAHGTIAALSAELDQCKARLANYENI